MARWKQFLFFSQRVFVSYSHLDSLRVQPRIDDLRHQAFRLWVDKQEMRAGEDLDEQIKKGIRLSAAVLVFATPRSVSSPWVLNEVQYALRCRKRIYLCRLEPAELPPSIALLNGLVWVDLSSGTDELEWRILLKALGRLRIAQFTRQLALLSISCFLLLRLALMVAPLEETPRVLLRPVFIHSDIVPIEVSIDGQAPLRIGQSRLGASADLCPGTHVLEATQAGEVYRRLFDVPDGPGVFVIRIP